MRDFETIRQMVVDMQRRRTYLIKYMLEVKRHYQADWVVPLPDVSQEPDVPLLTPALITDAVDNLAMRASSVHPVIFCPAIDTTKITGVRSMDYASTRRKIIAATYHESGWLLKRRRYYRHLAAYETASLFIEPDFRRGLPRIHVRDPLETFPEERSMESTDPPSYVAFITRYSGDELRRRFPQLRSEQGGPITNVKTTELWDIFEWVDEEQTLFGLLGPVYQEGDHVNQGFIDYFQHGPYMQLGPAIPNQAEVCLAIVPQEVTLHTIGNRLNALIGNVQMQARLMAMDIVAQQKAIFPDMFARGSDGRTPRIVNGAWQDGRTGNINLLQDVDQVGVINQPADIRTQQLIDRLERNFKVSSGLSPMMSGESFGSLRTGRALDAMMGASVEPRIQELHEVSETWIPHMNRAILACYKGYWAKKKYTMFSNWPTDRGHVEFIPEEHIESYENAVNYAIPGADIVQVTQVLGSMLGADVISSDTFQRQHPWIGDADAEQNRILEEKLERSMAEGLAQQIVTGQMPVAVFARVYELVKKQRMELHQALLKVDEEIREQQAAAQAAAMEQQQQQPMDPAAMLGLAAGPAAAAPGMPPAGMGPPELQGQQSPEAAMQALLAGALGGAV